jgi:hypothetical protein
MARSPAFWEAGRGIAMVRSVAIGRSVITVGVPGGTLITAGTRLSADADTADPAGLETALAEPEERRTIGELTERSVLTASEATDRVEQAADLLSDALAGKLVDLDRAGQVLDVLQRLDKDGRHEEWLRYARSVHGVLVLLKRWAELLRLLRTLLRSGDQVHAGGRAWAQHELGTLCLAAGDQKQAARLLEQARSTRERLRDADGLAATEQSLGVLCRRQAGAGGPGGRWRRIAVVAVALLLLVAGGVAGAIINRSERAPLSVAVDGAGLVTAASAAISCPDRCDAELERGTRVTLTASARRGSTFAGWDGDCSGTERCRLTMDGARTATARFERTPQARIVTVRRDGDGAGRVTSAAGIDCGGACRTSVESGTRVRLDADPDDGSTFAGWSGAGCEGTSPCEFTVREPVTVTALFTADTVPPGELVLNVKRRGNGRVTSRPAGIDCRDECDAPFPEGSSVALFQQADEGWVFAGWSGAGCSGTGECRVQMTQAHVVVARFAPSQPTRFTLTTATSGAGEVTPPCAQGCAYDAGTLVPLTATPAGDNNSVEWNGCTPAVPGDFSCQVTMSENREVSARFFFAEP